MEPPKAPETSPTERLGQIATWQSLTRPRYNAQVEKFLKKLHQIPEADPASESQGAGSFDCHWTAEGRRPLSRGIENTLNLRLRLGGSLALPNSTIRDSRIGKCRGMSDSSHRGGDSFTHPRFGCSRSLARIELTDV